MPAEKYSLKEMIEEIKQDELVHARKRDGLVGQDVITTVFAQAAENRKSGKGKADGQKS